MSKKVFINLVFVFLTNMLNAQNYTLYGDKTFGGNLGDSWAEIELTENNEIIVIGSSANNINGDKTEMLCDSIHSDAWIIKIDPSFNIIWDKSIGGPEGETVSDIISGGINQLIFCCTTFSDSACEKTEHKRNPGNATPDYWIYALDTIGNKIWDKTFGGTGPDNAPKITQLTSGNFVIAGASSSPVGADKTVANYGGLDYWVVAIDSIGNKLWDNVYGGSGFEFYGTGPVSGFSVLACENGSFILAGRTNSPVSGNVSDPGQGGFDIWIIKVDSVGNKIWDKRYGGTTGGEDCAKIIHSGSGYIVAGSTSSPQGGSITDPPIGTVGDVWILKLDSMGNKLWDKRYGGSIGSYCTSIENAPGGGYWVYGATSSPPGFDVTEPSYGGYDYWIFKIDSAGTKLWDRRFGGPGDENPSDFVIMPDSSIFLCGYADTGTSAVKTDFGKGSSDYWLIHFKYSDTNTGIIQPTNSSNQISLAQNPTKGIINLNSSLTGAATLCVSNVLGEKVYANKIVLQMQNTFDFSYLKTGLYFLQIQTEQFSNTVKFIKQ